MSMKIEVGKSYITRDGQHTGSLTNDPPDPNSTFPFWSAKLALSYDKNGRWCGFFQADVDIVEEVVPLVKLEAGKCYRTRDGRETGPLEDSFPDTDYPYQSDTLGLCYTKDGRYYLDRPCRLDIVEEVLYPFPNAVETLLPSNAEERKAIPVYTGFIQYFPRAIIEVTKLSAKGNIQHGIGDGSSPVWDRAKSPDEKDAMMRHIIDGDWAAVAWRAMANLEKELEKGE